MLNKNNTEGVKCRDENSGGIQWEGLKAARLYRGG